MLQLPQMPDLALGGVPPDRFFEKFAPSQQGWRSDLDSGQAWCLVSRRTNGSADARTAAKIPTGCPARFGDAGAGADCHLLGGRPGRGRSACCRRCHLPQRRPVQQLGRPRRLAGCAFRCLRAVLSRSGERLPRFAAVRGALGSPSPRRTSGVARGGCVRYRDVQRLKRPGAGTSFLFLTTLVVAAVHPLAIDVVE